MEFSSSRARRRVLAPLAVGLTLGLTLLAGCSGQTEPGDGSSEPGETVGWDEIDPIVIRHADFLGEKEVFGQTTLAFQEYVTEHTEGKVTFENYWSGSLIAAQDVLPSLRDGIADMGSLHPANFPQELPVSNWVADFGFGVIGSPVQDIAAGAVASYELTVDFEPITDEFAANGLKPIWYTASPTTMALCTEPIETVSEMQGVPIRASGAAQTLVVEALGAVPVTVAYGESYEAIQRGVVDCHLAPVGAWPPLSLHEVAQDFLPLAITQPFFSGVAMNLEFWESLPFQVQQVIHEAGGYAIYQSVLANFRNEAAFGDLLADGTVTVTDVTQLAPVVEEAREVGFADMVTSAPASVGDPVAAIDEVTGTRTEWVKILEELGYPVAESDPDALASSFVELRDLTLEDFYERFREEWVVPTMPKS
ncbi:TRAP transporter substrate-binding protein DctP [Microbacterium sp. NPDC055357]